MSKKYKSFTVKWHEYECKCTPVGRQEYQNCYIEAGRVTGHPTDTIYLKVSGDDIDDIVLLLRTDEVLAINWVLSGTLWCQELDRL